MKRDQVLGVIAAIVATVSAFLPWINRVTVLYDAGGKSSLSPMDIPLSFLFSGAGSGPATGSEVALLAVVLGLAGGLLIWTFLPRTIRRILYIVWALLAIATPVLLYMQLSGDVTDKNLDTSALTHLGLGAYLCAGAGLIALIAGIIGAGKQQRVVPAQPTPVQTYGAPYSQPAPGYGYDPYAGQQQQQWAGQTPDATAYGGPGGYGTPAQGQDYGQPSGEAHGQPYGYAHGQEGHHSSEGQQWPQAPQQPDWQGQPAPQWSTHEPGHSSWAPQQPGWAAPAEGAPAPPETGSSTGTEPPTNEPTPGE